MNTAFSILRTCNSSSKIAKNVVGASRVGAAPGAFAKIAIQQNKATKCPPILKFLGLPVKLPLWRLKELASGVGILKVLSDEQIIRAMSHQHY
jgi:hypothetical protein